MRKIALFDFCETLVSFYTADAYVDYVRSKKGYLFMEILDFAFKCMNKTKLIFVLDKILPGFEKGFKLFQLAGISYKILDDLALSFYKESIRTSFIHPVLNEMQTLAKQGYELCIVSAGYSIYLKYFAKEFEIEHVIATDIAFTNSGRKCKGTIDGKDCYKGEKVNRIYAYFDNHDVNFHESVSYSDSISDLPMLSMTGKAVVVSRTASNSWNKEYKFREIIWS